MDPSCPVDTLSAYLQSCEPFSVTDSDFPSNLVVSNISSMDNFMGTFNSIIATESNGQRDDVGRDEVSPDDASEAVDPNIVQSPIQPTTCKSKFKQKNDNQRVSRKSSRLADQKAVLDLVFLKVARRQRSGLCKQARSSAWGSLKHIREVFKQSPPNDADQNEHRELLKGRSAQRGGKRKKNRRSQSSETTNNEVPAISRCIRLKVKVGKQTSPSCPLNVLPSADEDLDNSGGVMKSLELSIDESNKLGEESDSFNENLNKATVPLEVSFQDLRLPDKAIKGNLGAKTAENLHENPAEDGVRGSSSEETTEYTCLDPGTSPDSEVINVNPEAQISRTVSEDQEGILISSKDVCHGDLTSLSPLEISSEKGGPRDMLCQAINPCSEGGLPGKELVDDCVLFDRLGQMDILEDIPCNGYASSSEEGHIEPLHSSSVTEVGSFAEILKVESGGEFELSHGIGLESQESQLSEKLHPDAAATSGKLGKSSKAKVTSNGKSEGSEAVNKKRSNYRQKVCEEKSSGGQTIKENDVDELVCKVQSFPETGVDEIDDVKYGRQSAIEGSSNLNMLASGFGDQHGSTQSAWVCCDDCYKWRRISSVLADSIGASNCRWICKDNMDKDFADCSIPQEKSSAAINAELEISDEEDNPDTRLNSSQAVQKQPTVPVQAPWKLIRSNLFLHRNRKNQSIDEVMVCHCKPPLDGRKGCRDGCLNRMLNIECAKGTCPCGELCSNQQFQKRKYAKLKCFRCGKKGFGLQAQEDIPKGRFLIEYVGEVLDMHAHEARQREYASKGHKHFYFMTLNGSEVIDACAKGNLGRFINHSCDPNCQTEKWMVNGEVCIGLFAVRDIKKGEEVTFDYNYVRVFGAAAKKCVCGSSLCRGYIGGDPQSTEVIVQSDSDDEYPEPVMLNEDCADKSDKLMPETGFVDGTQILSPASLLQSNVEIDKGMTDVGHLEITNEKIPPKPLFEEKACNGNSTTTVSRMEVTPSNEGLTSTFDAIKSEPSSELGPLLGVVSPLQAEPKPSQPISHVGIPLQTNEGKITSEDPNEFSGGEEDEALSFCTRERNETSSLSSTVSNLSPAISKVKVRKSKIIKDETVRLASKSHTRTKSSRSPSLVKGVKPKSNVANLNPPQIENHSLTVPCKKKLSQGPLDGRFEAVQQTLNELLDADGGVSKRKDASRGYLKLLYQTAASGGSANGEGIQSNRDLSMILDALLKTKSRAVMVDILNKNGLQMLHNIMKRCRKEFTKTPILRKLLKVLEYLAVREILTVETINRGPTRAGVISFKASILELTEHNDKQVHQIARSFRDRWIHRRRHNFVERDVDRMDIQKGSNFNRSSASRGCSSDRDGKSKEAIGNSSKQSSNTNSLPLTSGVLEDPSASCTNSGISSSTRTRKRKSRWDQPADTASTSNKELCQRVQTDDGHKERQVTDEDAPPGFSSPLKGNYVQSNISKIATDEVVIGQPQERFISRMPVSYGVPLSILQQLETPQSMAVESWVIAPAAPFQPFPPLPPHPCDRSGPQHSSCPFTVNRPAEEHLLHNPVTYHSDRNQNTLTTSDTGPMDISTPPCPNNQPNFPRGGPPSHSLGRKYFRQQKWNNPRNTPPWIHRNNGWGGFKGPVNPSNGMTNGVNRPHGHFSSGLSSGPGFPYQPQQ